MIWMPAILMRWMPAILILFLLGALCAIVLYFYGDSAGT